MFVGFFVLIARRIFLLALIYYVTGRAGLLLAVPPSYATIFWPPSGFSFGFVYLYGYGVLPGVWIGSFLLNFLTYFNSTAPGDIPVLFINAFCIATGAAASSFVQAYLVRRFVGTSIRLENVGEILRFSFLAGPVGCLVAPLFGPNALVLTHTIPPSSFWFVWMTWYVGDSLGVLVFAPILILIFNAQPITAARKFLVTVPLAIIFATVIMLFFWIRYQDEKSVRENFSHNAEIVQQELSKQFAGYMFELLSLRDFYDSSNFVDHREFHTFSAHAFIRHPGIQAMEWVQYMRQGELEKYVVQAGEMGFPDFSVKELNSEGQLVPAGQRDEYFPVFYTEPDSDNKKVAGFDLGSEPTRKESLMRSLAENAPIATSRIRLIQEREDNVFGFLIVLPVFKKNAEGAPLSAGKDALDGFVVGVYRFPDIVNPVIEPWAKKGIYLRLFDESAPEEESLLYGQQSDGSYLNKDKGALVEEIPFSYAGRDWKMQFYTPSSYILQNVNWSIWYTLGGSLAFIFFTSTLLLVITGQTAVVEKEVNEKTKEVQDKSHFLQTIMDTVPDTVFVKNAKFEIIQGNQAFFNIYAPDMREKLIGSTGLEQFPPRQQDAYTEQDRRALEDGYAETQEDNTDYKGITRTLFTKKVRFENSDGEPFVLGVARDVTKEIEAERELKRSNRELEEFAYVASHDLKAPLRHVSMSAGFLRDQYADKFDDEGREMMNVIASSTERMQKMIDSLLAYSRVGRKDVKMEEVDLGQMLQELQETIGNHLQEKNTTLEIGEMPAVYADKYLLVQLFQNLIENSIKYKKKDQDPLIRISALRREDAWEFSVADNGIGIDPKYADKVFMIFQRLHHNDEYGGVGIGLAICQRIADFHGGKIWLDTSYKDGTKFVFTLPVIR